ncbi:hypothetical protein SKAU_G00219980 [Synaphobranchus kaupii]|uniref:Aryl hydrocarbon receptor n=1 Tax=Synaphobranchus kaupii TaxID=118154 RepID=A0A9Q1FAK6_SYNKA|nr:hypothetical protein SKAU_G00219980 [Synaphobranchus kaupii]
MNTNTMYATRKRRKPIQKSVKPSAEGAKSNPSKRHRDRLNGELECLANLLPFPQDVISKLDKLTVLRLSVSYLRAKSFFNVTLKSDSCPKPDGNGLKQPEENFQEGELLLQVLNGFVLVATADGVVLYVSSTVQDYLGFHQSDVIHQNVYDLIHTEDRLEFRRQLHWALDPALSPEAGQESSDGTNAQLPLAYYRPEQLPPENSAFLERNFVCRVRCLLDNSSGFLAVNFQGRLKFLHGQKQRMKDGQPAPPQLALFAIASPLQPPSILEIRTKNFIFRTKHKLDFTPTACDAKGKTVLGYTEAELCYRGTGYQFIHAADILHCAENHIRMMKTGESGMTVFRLLTKQSRWVWVQANARLVYKNGKPECIIASQRVITDEEGDEDIRKRNLKLPFGFTTGEAVLYDTNGMLMDGDSSQSKGTKSLDPNSLLGAMLKQDESAYLCVPAQNQNTFQHGAQADSGEDQIFSRDWQDDILSLSENGIFKRESINSSLEDNNGDLLSFMKGLGMGREDLELIQKDEEFLQVSLDEQGDIMDVADGILSYVQESLNKTSDCIFSNTAERKPPGRDTICSPQRQQPDSVPHLPHGQPLLLPQQQKPVLQQHLHAQMRPQQTFPQQYLHTQTHPHQPISQRHPHTQTQQLISQQHPHTQTKQLIPQHHSHTQTQQLISQQYRPQTQQLTQQQHSQPQQLIPQQHPHTQTKQIISQQQTQQLIPQHHPHTQTQQLAQQQHTQTQQLIQQQHPQTQQLTQQQHPQTQQLISQQYPHRETQQLISQQHLHMQVNPHQPIPQQHLHTQAPQWQSVPQQHALIEQQITQQHPLTWTYPQQTAPQQHLHAQMHPQHQIPQEHIHTQTHPTQNIPQQHAGSELTSLFPPQQEQPLVLRRQLLGLQQPPSQTLEQPQLSHRQQRLPLKQYPQLQPSLPEQQLQPSLPEQQRQLCHEMKRMQVDGQCPSLKQPVAVPTANGRPLPPPLFRPDWSLPQYGPLVQEGSALGLPYQPQLNTVSVACSQGFSPYGPTEGLAAGEAAPFTPQDLEDLLQSLQPGATVEQHCASVLQDGRDAPLCHPAAPPTHQPLPQTSGLGHGQQVNPKLLTPGTPGHQPFLSNFQNGNGGAMSQTHPESTGGIDLPQPGFPLHQHPDESRPF